MPANHPPLQSLLASETDEELVSGRLRAAIPLVFAMLPMFGAAFQRPLGGALGALCVVFASVPVPRVATT